MHLGKHGTLEWLPGKTLALSAGCAPDAALGDMPLVYPFVVNDPGEGVQAKRRVHAVIVDHLVPPMMRADTYDEMAELEALLDEYARLEVLDPSKLPSLAVRIWERDRARQPADRPRTSRSGPTTSRRSSSTSTATSARSRTSRSRTACTCSASRRAAIRCAASCPPSCASARATSPACAAPSGAAFGLDEPALVAAAGSPAPGAVPELLVALPRPVGELRAISSIASRPRRWRCWTRSPRRTGTPDVGVQVCLDVLGRRRRRCRARASLRRRARSSRASCRRPTSSAT